METEYLLCRFGVHLLDLFQYIERIVLQPHHIGIVEFPLELVNTVLQPFDFLLIFVVIVEQPDNRRSNRHRRRNNRQDYAGFLYRLNGF